MPAATTMEFRYADGTVGTAQTEEFRQFARGDEFEHDGHRWVMYDRVDRAGVTVHLFAPAATALPSASRARTRRRGQS
jgi:hypothetical protein